MQQGAKSATMPARNEARIDALKIMSMILLRLYERLKLQFNARRGAGISFQKHRPLRQTDPGGAVRRGIENRFHYCRSPRRNFDRGPGKPQMAGHTERAISFLRRNNTGFL